MKRITIFCTALVAFASVATAETTAETTAKRRAAAPRIPAATVMQLRPASEGTLEVDFTVKGVDALAPVSVYNFDDNNISDWKVDPASDVITWTTKRIGAEGTAKSFSAIDPSDVASLYVDGPYQTYKRAKSSIISPSITVPEQATLSFYVGYSLNYNDVASLVLEISDDGFETATQLWNSIDQPGEKPWAWRKVDADIAKFAGKEVKLRFTYGPGTADTFGTGGYLGDFAIDALTVSGLKPVENVGVLTGEKITFVPVGDYSGCSLQWAFPGAVTPESTGESPTVYYTADGNYDVTLTVTDASGRQSAKTRTGFVTVTGTAPVAKIIPPATFRHGANRKHLVAPMVPVQFRCGSEGFPTKRQWSFNHADADPDVIVYSDEECPEVSYAYLHDHVATLSVENAHGQSDAICEVTAEYSSTATNLQPGDTPMVFDMEDWGLFPGSNTRKITAYAERFSAPSRPVMIDGAYVYFTRADATEVADQIANVGVHLYTSKDGLPDRKLDSFWWSVFELDLPSGGEMVGTAFPFTEAPFVDGEFFIVVDGIPEYTETCAVAFSMSKMRDAGNSALMLKEGKWMEVSDYFPAGANHTSYMIYPSVHHSVMASLKEGDPVHTVGATGGTADYPVFSYLGYKTPVESDSQWLRANGEPNGLTVDNIHIEADPLPEGVTRREGTLTLTDGASLLPIKVVQSVDASVSAVVTDRGEFRIYPTVVADSFMAKDADGPIEVFSLSGDKVIETECEAGTATVDVSALAPGAYVVVNGNRACKIIKK